ncbi:hypothetical protein KAW65_01495 [candidate division WOR-3 bacterium]|nr:hypothetical protein [candidate division WOR-3 bacterium]
MKVGFLQFEPFFKEKEKNLQKIEKLLENVNAELLVLPELATTGYAFETKKELFPLAEPIPGPSTKRLAKIASSKNISLVFGIAELDESRSSCEGRDENNIYNSAVLISPRGSVYKYRKIHLFFREKLIFTPGNLPFEAIDIKGVKLGLLICFDWLFPEATRTLSLKGAQIICHPANLVLPYCQPVMQTRAIENRVFIITSNRTGIEKNYKFTGKSQVVNPKGEVILKARQEECVKIIEIEPKEALDKNLNEYNNIFKDRREDFYFK